MDAPTPPTRAPACDEAKTAALAKALRTTPPADQPARLAAHLDRVCTLPEPITTWFAANATRSSHASDAFISDAVVKVFEDRCPAAPTLRTQLLALPRAEQPAALYDGCKLAEHGLIERDAYLTSRSRSVMPWLAHHWLRTEGMAIEDARTIANALLVWDAPRIFRRTQSLPTTTVALEPPPRGAIVRITADTITLDDAVVVSLDAGRLPDADGTVSQVPAFFEALEAVDGMAEHGTTLVIVADSNTPEVTLLRILATADTRGRYRRAFVLETPQGFGAVVTPSPHDATDRDPFAVHVSADGFQVTSSSAASKPERRDVPDVSGVATAAKAHLAAHPTAGAAIVVGHAGVDVQRLVQTLAALSAEFPTVSVSTRLAALPPPPTSDVLDLETALLQARKTALIQPLRTLTAPGPSDLAEADDIRSAIKKHTSSLQHCYEKGLRRDPTLAGKVTVLLEVGMDGSVTAAKFESNTVADKAVSRCMLSKIKGWTFAPQQDQLNEISFSVVFSGA